MPSPFHIREHLGIRSRDVQGSQSPQSHDQALPGSSVQPNQNAFGSVTIPAQNRTRTKKNVGLMLAIEKHIDELPDTEKNAFRQAAETLTTENLFHKIKLYDENHRSRSSFRPQADKVVQLLGLLDRFLGGLSIGTEAGSGIAPVVVGGVRAVLNIVIRFAEFFGKFTTMLCRFNDWLGPLEELYKDSPDNSSVVTAVSNVYADLLKFCREAYKIFADGAANPKKYTTLRAFVRVQWKSFEEVFGVIEVELSHHLNVLLHSTVATNSTALQVEVKRRFLEWLSSDEKVDFERTHDTIFGKKHPGTSDWLFSTQRFRSWFDAPTSSLLWCYGKPGAGKSVLASNVVEYVTAQQLMEERTGITFAYYNYQNNELKDTSVMIAALIKQLCQQLRFIPQWLYQLHSDARSPYTVSTPEGYVKTAEEFDRLFLVIDALDECTEQERHRVLEFITTLVQTLPCAKVFVTSRHFSDIKTFSDRHGTPVIRIEAERVSHDIRLFVSDEVKRLRSTERLHIKSDSLETRIIESLSSRADGMFLWVNLQLENLCKVSKAKKDRLVQAELAKLPRDIEDTYERILQTIEAQEEYMRDLAHKCLMWVTNSKRPLQTIELQYALAFTFARDEDRTWTDIEEDLDDVGVMLEACGNLIHEENGMIRFIHQSVQEFLGSSAKLIEYTQPEFLRQPSLAHAEMSKCCLGYLTTTLFSRSPCSDLQSLAQRIQGLPFCQYASQCFDHHIKKSDGHLIRNSEMIETFLQNGGSFLGAVMQVRNEELTSLRTPSDSMGLGYEVNRDLMVLTTDLYDVAQINNGLSMDKISRTAIGDAVRQAIVSAQQPLFERLVNEAQDFDLTDSYHATPLYHASVYGRTEIVKLLLAKNVNVNAQGGHFGYPLQAAIYGSHEEVVRSLLEHGADADRQGGHLGNALQCATSRSDINTVRMLLDLGVNVNAQNGYFGSAVQAAAFHGANEIIRLLLDHSADCNAQSGYFGSPLQAASYLGRTDTVRLLLDHGADVNARGGYYGNALNAACLAFHHSRFAIIEMLVQKGADGNAQGGQYATALQAAALRGNVRAIQLLLDNGADVNAQGGMYGSALQAAAVAPKGHDKAVKMLLDGGAHVNARGGKFGTALAAATSRRYTSRVRMLLDAGAETTESLNQQVDDEDKQSKAVQKLQTLLQHGVDDAVTGASK